MSDNCSQPLGGQVGSPLPPQFADLPNGCPPPEAVAGGGVFYCNHKGEVPGPDDFKTAYDRGLHPDVDECERKSNSVNADLNDARELAKRFRRPLGRISRGSVGPEHGKALHTPSSHSDSHHSLWLYPGVRMHQIFRERVT